MTGGSKEFMAIAFLSKIGVSSPRRASPVGLVLGQKQSHSLPLAPVGVRFAYVRGHHYSDENDQL